MWTCNDNGHQTFPSSWHGGLDCASAWREVSSNGSLFLWAAFIHTIKIMRGDQTQSVTYLVHFVFKLLKHETSFSQCSFILHSVRLHAPLSRITAIVRLCYSVRQLQLSEYTCWWENRIVLWSMSYPGTIGGAVPISTSGNRAISSWPLYVTSNNKLPRHLRKMAYKERDKATSLYILYMVYMIITQTRCTMVLFLAVILEERRRPFTSSSRPRERNLVPAQNAKIQSSLIRWCVYMQE